MISSKYVSLFALGSAMLVISAATLAPKPAFAGSDGKKNTALVLGAASIYELVKGKTAIGAVLGAGAVVAAKQYEDTRHSESQNKNRGRYYRDDNYGYGNGETYQNNRNNQDTGDYERTGNPNNRQYSDQWNQNNNQNSNWSQGSEQYGNYRPIQHSRKNGGNRQASNSDQWQNNQQYNNNSDGQNCDQNSNTDRSQYNRSNRNQNRNNH